MSSGGDGGDDGGDDDDGDGDDVQLDDGDDGVDFPLREGISPADSCPPESSFLSGVLRPAEAAVTLREVPSVASVFGTKGLAKKRRRKGSWALHTTGRRGQGLGRAALGCGPTLAAPGSSFWLPSSS